MESVFSLQSKVAFITGGARRIGAVIVRMLHAQGMNVVFQYRESREEAMQLCDELNGVRPNSVYAIAADLLLTGGIPRLMEETVAVHGRLDAVVNSASAFYPTPLETLSETDWDVLMNINAKAPLFITKAAAPHLARQHETSGGGCVVNIADIYGVRPLAEHPIYCAAKAALIMLTKSLARELGPAVRVNAIAPGAILWPTQGMDDTRKERLLARTPLKRLGQPEDIARAALFLIRDACYSTGEVIVVDGGRGMIE
uniref:Pteridine reductase n=1 Tax=Candidatus Kentrum eta TaxID=2126337 RepID=A0A450V4W7_9GAMM|nr:MAG: pteridine reductase [Candidatus Kentron sp. H]VFJ99864.1 MAG: pteridine reductase [Candidatus Kentron sp. H]VFK04237.1 MAG: pteridine reductase [Candidatus Kentron sp. H]